MHSFTYLYITYLFMLCKMHIQFLPIAQKAHTTLLYQILQTSDRRYSTDKSAKMENNWILHNNNASAFTEEPNSTHQPITVLSRSCSVALLALPETGLRAHHFVSTKETQHNATAGLSHSKRVWDVQPLQAALLEQVCMCRRAVLQRWLR